MNEERSRGKYTLEFKQEAVRQVKAGRAASVVAKTLGMPKASLTNWVRAAITSVILLAVAYCCSQARIWLSSPSNTR